jgi:hypothetical protein
LGIIKNVPILLDILVFLVSHKTRQVPQAMLESSIARHLSCLRQLETMCINAVAHEFILLFEIFFLSKNIFPIFANSVRSSWV